MTRRFPEGLCAMCGGERIPGRITSTTDLGDCVLVVRNVPATVCNQCGEEWLDDSTVRELHQLTEEARQRGTLLEVRSLASLP